MAAANPLDEILNSSVDELAINALVGNLEARLASPSNKEVSNSLTDASVNNNHIDTTSSTSLHSQSTVFNSGAPVGSNGDTGLSHKNVVNSHVQSPSPKTDSQLIGINSIINPVNSTQQGNILNSLPLNRSSPVPESNRNQSPHLRTVTNSPGLMNARNSPVPSPSNTNVNSPHTIKSFSVKTENSAIQNVVTVTGDQKLSMSQGNCIPIVSSQHNSVKQEPSASAQLIVKSENASVTNVKSEPKTAAIQAVTGPHNSASGNHITATNVHIVNAPMKGQPGVITVKTPGTQVVMRPQIVHSVSNSGQMQVVNVSANSPRPPGIVQVPQQGKPQAIRFAPSPARHSQVHIAPRPGGTTVSGLCCQK